jgi:hypothetical protein
VQVKQGENLVVVTQPINQIVESVKIQDQKGVFKELDLLGNNVYSLDGIPVGAYVLDVIVDLGSNKKEHMKLFSLHWRKDCNLYHHSR